MKFLQKVQADQTAKRADKGTDIFRERRDYWKAKAKNESNPYTQEKYLKIADGMEMLSIANREWIGHIQDLKDGKVPIEDIGNLKKVLSQCKEN